MTKRHDDPEDFDASSQRRVSSRSPWWVQAVAMIGVPAVISFYLLGMIPGAHSPFDAINDSIRATASVVERHERSMAEALRVYRLTCAGVWQSQPAVARTCYRNGVAEIP